MKLHLLLAWCVLVLFIGASVDRVGVAGGECPDEHCNDEPDAHEFCGPFWFCAGFAPCSPANETVTNSFRPVFCKGVAPSRSDTCHAKFTLCYTHKPCYSDKKHSLQCHTHFGDTPSPVNGQQTWWCSNEEFCGCG